MAYYTVSPKNYYKMLWDVTIGFVYMISYLVDPFVFSFHFEPLQTR